MATRYLITIVTKAGTPYPLDDLPQEVEADQWDPNPLFDLPPSWYRRPEYSRESYARVAAGLPPLPTPPTGRHSTGLLWHEITRPLLDMAFRPFLRGRFDRWLTLVFADTRPNGWARLAPTPRILIGTVDDSEFSLRVADTTAGYLPMTTSQVVNVVWSSSSNAAAESYVASSEAAYANFQTVLNGGSAIHAAGDPALADDAYRLWIGFDSAGAPVTNGARYLMAIRSAAYAWLLANLP